MEKLFNLISLQRRALETSSRDALTHLITNETLQLVPYRTAIFWGMEHGLMKLEKVSGNATIDDKSSFANMLKNFIKKQLKAKKNQSGEPLLIPFSGQDTPFDDGMDTDFLLIIFQTENENVLGGVWFQNSKPFSPAEIKILEELTVTYTKALSIFHLQKKRGISDVSSQLKAHKKYVLLSVLLIAFFPVRLSVTAPAEIIARSPDVITAPYNGVLEDILVQPGDTIEVGTPIAQMEKLALISQMEQTEQELQIAKTLLSRLKRESISKPEKKAEIRKLQLDIEAKEVAFSFAKKQAEKSQIISPKTGIAIFSDAQSLEGKPVRTGEEIMQVADPNNIELLIRVPVDAMAPLKKETDIDFFLNVSPLFSYGAQLKSMGYQASLDADGLLTYKLVGTIDKEHQNLRIGWKGTAKIYSEWAFLSYAFLRRPLAHLRALLGL